MTASCGWQKGNDSGDDFSQAESCWSDIELVWDVKENFQVWKVSQIKTKGEIKDSLFKAIALVHSSWFSHYTVVGTGWFELGYEKWIFRVLHCGSRLLVGYVWLHGCT